MMQFDDYAKSYSHHVEDAVSFCGLKYDFFVRNKVEVICDILKKLGKTPSPDLRCLDVGCGVGDIDKRLKNILPNISGVDVSEKSLSVARQNNPDIEYQIYDGEILPFEDKSFGLAFAVNVIHHIKPDRWKSFAGELHRVVAGGGVIIIIEHNPYNFLTRKSVNMSVLDRGAVFVRRKILLDILRTRFEHRRVLSKYILFFPFDWSVFRRMERLLGWFPLGAQYYVALVK